MLFVCGDIHGERMRLGEMILRMGNYPGPHTLLVCGDFGFTFSEEELTSLRGDMFALEGEVEILFVDGNHENFDCLNGLPVEEYRGALTQVLAPNVRRLMRGEVVELEGKTFLALGGARSTDRDWREELRVTTGQRFWWPEELPGPEAVENARANLRARGWKVDYILSHAAPAGVLKEMNLPAPHPAEREFLSGLELIRRGTEFRNWFFGHYHVDETFENCRCLYRDLVIL